MTPFQYTLLANGSSDRCLIRVIDWVLGQFPPLEQRGFIPQIVDPRYLSRYRKKLHGRMSTAIVDYPCGLLFVHRDAEGQRLEARITEIGNAAAAAGIQDYVPIVPVRMTEAWLLLDEQSIRQAADNPNGTVPLPLPRRSPEELPDPKKVLRECLVAASEKKGRRLLRFERDISRRMQRVATFIDDFSPLRSLNAFIRFEQDTLDALRKIL